MWRYLKLTDKHDPGESQQYGDVVEHEDDLAPIAIRDAGTVTIISAPSQLGQHKAGRRRTEKVP